MIFHQIKAGGDRNFAYLAADAPGGKGALFDPPPDESLYLPLLDDARIELLYIIATHGHGDHTWGIARAKELTSAKTVLSDKSGERADIAVSDGQTLPLGTLSMQFIHTPGHTEDSMCILAGDKLITGDTLFVGKVGGTDFGQGARREWDSIRNKLLTLGDHIEVYPGHDYGVRPSSTIGEEKRSNPFILRETFEDFVDLKKNWLRYKQEHGID